MHVTYLTIKGCSFRSNILEKNSSFLLAFYKNECISRFDVFAIHEKFNHRK